MIRRFKAVLELLKENKLSFDRQNVEHSYILDMLQGFFVLNFENGLDSHKNQAVYKKYIFDKMVEIYLEYYKVLKVLKNEAYYLTRDFVATLLLKFEHRKQLVFLYYGI